MINELEIEETEGYIEISQSLGEESYLIIRCFPDGRIELLEISQYGGEERHCGFFWNDTRSAGKREKIYMSSNKTGICEGNSSAMYISSAKPCLVGDFKR